MNDAHCPDGAHEWVALHRIWQVDRTFITLKCAHCPAWSTKDDEPPTPERRSIFDRLFRRRRTPANDLFDIIM